MFIYISKIDTNKILQILKTLRREVFVINSLQIVYVMKLISAILHAIRVINVLKLLVLVLGINKMSFLNGIQIVYPVKIFEELPIN